MTAATICLSVLVTLASAAGVVFLILCGFAQRFIDRTEDERPGRCGICEFWIWGQQKRLISPEALPPDHRCAERMDRWRGALHRRLKMPDLTAWKRQDKP